MATFFDETIQVNSGTTTAWLPISTPWLSIAVCSAQIYAQRTGLGGNLIAFDLLYGESIIPSAIPFLPTEIASSWYQSYPSITTLLGPNFVCLSAYSAVQTIFGELYAATGPLLSLVRIPPNHASRIPV